MSHSGHRQRMRERFLCTGIRDMAEHEVLELLLTYAIPRADVNPLAHSLVARFGSLRNVLNADAGELRQVSGCGENSAVLLKLVREIARVMEQPDLEKVRLITPEQAGFYLRALLRGIKHECIYALYLSASLQLLGERLVTEGTIDQSAVYPRRIIEYALSLGASSVILAHNHPGGALQASLADIQATERIEHALDAVDIKLLEHYLVSEDGIYGICAGQTFNAPAK